MAFAPLAPRLHGRGARFFYTHRMIVAAAQLLDQRLDRGHRPAKGGEAAPDGVDEVGIAAADAVEPVRFGKRPCAGVLGVVAAAVEDLDRFDALQRDAAL